MNFYNVTFVEVMPRTVGQRLNTSTQSLLRVYVGIAIGGHIRVHISAKEQTTRTKSPPIQPKTFRPALEVTGNGSAKGCDFKVILPRVASKGREKHEDGG
ncbi:hypothetical protein VN97_g640 [Penicillium thymicola]|uniref:Uncharacterized protein n=1 Tax=Penicillium thymicola TaxID=293382 RepID=A0AAI9TT82_PENTH|nr:hypothetical protein VN97_g640 [Penicillium thymicola]